MTCDITTEEMRIKKKKKKKTRQKNTQKNWLLIDQKDGKHDLVSNFATTWLTRLQKCSRFDSIDIRFMVFINPL